MASTSSPPPFDPVRFSQKIADLLEQAQPVLGQIVDRWQAQGQSFDRKDFDPLNLRETLFEFWSHLAQNPNRMIDWQMETWQNWLHLAQQRVHDFFEDPSHTHPAESPAQPRDDRRFRDPAWKDNAWFDFIKDSYWLYADALKSLVETTEGLSPLDRRKLEFYTRQLTDALSPSNFLFTNPVALRETIETRGENILKGLGNLIHDLRQGKGQLKIRTTDESAFALGKNLAASPGKVVYRTDLFELIQYAPLTPHVFETPLLIIPPWINKFYILDLKAESSFIRYAVAAGHTVFVVSWVNPDASYRNTDFDDYALNGILKALDAVRRITQTPSANVIGYCIGGTTLSMVLSYLQRHKRAREIACATFFTTLIDFSNAGDLTIFIDDQQLASMENKMSEQGFLDAHSLQQTFAMLRANDMIWSFVINNYLLGKDPFPFDLLYWNDDSTNLPARMQKTYLRDFYRDNKLIEPGGISIKKTPIDLRNIKTPCYFLSTREDHIAPWMCTYNGAQNLRNANITFTLSGSGHIAGVINPPLSGKYPHWTGRFHPTQSAEDWLKKAQRHDGSWWPHWLHWIVPYGGKKVPARIPGSTRGFPALDDAPGPYVVRRADDTPQKAASATNRKKKGVTRKAPIKKTSTRQRTRAR